MTDTVFKKLPGVLSFQRGIVISDAPFYNEIGGQFEQYLVYVIRHGIRGTQNTNKSGNGETAVAAEAKRQEISNIQTTDSAKLAPDADALIVRFSLRFLDFSKALFACAPGAKDTEAEIAALRQSIDGFIDRAKTSDGILEVARRYARNIANARWLWRNRLIARTVTVTVNHDGKHLATIDALRVPLGRFDDYLEDEKNVAHVIVEGLRGDVTATLDILARVEFGGKGAIEVFPSQNYIEDKHKPRGFARSLYCLGAPERADKTTGIRRMGHAALRDQKISNALRTIDTWYPDFPTFGRPIPVEPNGANLEAQTFFRDAKKISAFDMVKRLNQLDPSSPDGMFAIASLIRGGVFSESGK
jgi:CRISPR-associated protein Csy3